MSPLTPPPSPAATNKQELDPLPDLPEAGEDRFFSKEALDFQYATGTAETPLFPTWGSTGAEMASIGAAAAAAAPSATAMTLPPSATAATATAVGVASKYAPSAPAPQPAARTFGTKRALPEAQLSPRAPARPAVSVSGADRTVFLRKRLGGESVSSGNSSTSTCSDNGSASEDVAGEWEGGGDGGDGGGGGGRGGGAPRSKHVVQGPPGFSRADLRNGGSATTAGTTAAIEAEATAAARAAVAGPAGSTQAVHATTLRNRFAGPRAKRHRYKKPRASGGGGGSSGQAGGLEGEGYASWDALVKPLKQQWDHVEAPAVGPSGGASKAEAMPLESGSACSVFSPEPRPNDTTSFSVEQCSAQAHPMAVASYVLRVRCGGGAHVVRRTWDDIVSLCTMLGRDLALPPTSAPSMVVAAAAAAAASDIGVGSASGVGIGIGIDAGRSGSTRGVTASVEFTPADVLALDAASGFLRDLLARPGMALVVPVRRFLELEFLDGTLRGGSADSSRETTARQVATMASSSVAARPVPAATPPLDASVHGALSPAGEGRTTVGLDGRPRTGAGGAQGRAIAPAATAGLRHGASQLLHFDASRAASSLPAHPDAARDLAAVCRCLGELGAAAFTSLPRVMGAASYWPERDDGASAPAAAAMAVTGSGRLGVPQLGMTLA